VKRGGNIPAEFVVKLSSVGALVPSLSGFAWYVIDLMQVTGGDTYLRTKLVAKVPREGSANFWLSFHLRTGEMVMRDGQFARLVNNMGWENDGEEFQARLETAARKLMKKHESELPSHKTKGRLERESKWTDRQRTTDENMAIARAIKDLL